MPPGEDPQAVGTRINGGHPMRHFFTTRVRVILIIAILLAVVLTVIGSFLIDGRGSVVGYRELFFNCFPFYRMFWNSVLYAGVITVCNIVVSVPAAFAFLHARFKGKELLFFLYIVLMMMPSIGRIFTFTPIIALSRQLPLRDILCIIPLRLSASWYCIC